MNIMSPHLSHLESSLHLSSTCRRHVGDMLPTCANVANFWPTLHVDPTRKRAPTSVFCDVNCRHHTNFTANHHAAAEEDEEERQRHDSLDKPDDESCNEPFSLEMACELIGATKQKEGVKVLQQVVEEE